MQMEAAGSFETFVCIYQSTRRHVPEDGTVQDPLPHTVTIPSLVYVCCSAVSNGL